MTEKSLVVGIDQGTTGTCVSALSLDGEALARSYVQHTQYHPAPGFVEHDAKEIWLNTGKAVLDVLNQVGSSVDVAAVAIANQGETVLAWDKVTGEPLHRALVWQDTRTQPEMRELARRTELAERVTRITGLRLDPYFSAPKIKWLLENVPSVRRCLESRRLCLGTLDAWLIFKLTEGASFVTDHSTAARTLLYDISTFRYDSELLDLFNVPLECLPRILDTAGHFGSVRGFDPRIDGAAITASMVDQPAAMYGHGCVARGALKATFGTGCFIYMNLGEKLLISKSGLLSTIGWKIGDSVAYALDGGVFSAGSVISWLEQKVGLISSPSELDPLANSVSDTDGVVFVPALSGLAAPYWERDARAMWLGMGLNTEKAHMVRACLDGIAARVTEVVRVMEKESGIKVTLLRADGGLTKSSYLMQAVADRVGIPVEVADDPEVTVMGVSYMAARSIGYLKDKSYVTGEKVTKVFRPLLNSVEREARMKKFAEAVQLAVGFRPQF